MGAGGRSIVIVTIVAISCVGTYGAVRAVMARVSTGSTMHQDGFARL